MIYDLGQPIDKERAERRFEQLKDKGAVIDLTEKRLNRSLSQNSYLHLLLGWFAMEYGETLEYVKQNYFKRLVNSELFVESKEDKFLGSAEVLRSSSDLDTKEMTTAIDRFRDWSAREGGIYLPMANEHHFLQSIEIEMSKHSRL